MLIDRDEKINWFRVIIDLERSGYSHSSIGIAVGSPKSTVQGWKQGSTPKFEDGERLIELWQTVTENGRESVHKVKRASFMA